MIFFLSIIVKRWKLLNFIEKSQFFENFERIFSGLKHNLVKIGAINLCEFLGYIFDVCTFVSFASIGGGGHVGRIRFEHNP